MLEWYKQRLAYLNWLVLERYRDRARVDGQRDLIFEVIAFVEMGASTDEVRQYLVEEMAHMKANLAGLESWQWRKERWCQGRLAIAKRLLKELDYAKGREAARLSGHAEND